MGAIFPLEVGNKKYLIGAFNDTPIVKLPLDGIQQGAKLRSETTLDLGPGNRPIDMFSYTKNGKTSVIINLFRFKHAQDPISPSPYWTCRFDRDLLHAKRVNEDALVRDVKNPADPRMTMVAPFHGVRFMSKRDEASAVVLREAEGGRLDLEILSLP
jgi:hypothetical protein